MEIQCWTTTHEHPLRLREDSDNHQFSCQICNSRIESHIPFYSCDSCSDFYAHKCCSQLPHQIQHPFHPHSPLTFHPNKSTWCDSCLRFFYEAQFSSCGSCYNFKMDSECALMPLPVTSDRLEGRDWIRHFGHPHPLLLHVDPPIKCFGCNSGGDHQALYGCSKCHYFLHKSCAQLPQKLYLPFHHRYHHNEFNLQIMPWPFNCNKCGTRMAAQYIFRFSCTECSYDICFKCTGITSSRNIEYEDHQHPLRLIHYVKETASFLSLCKDYGFYCTQRVVTNSEEFEKTNSSILWCFYCGFKVHLLCGPLPSVIKHEFHTHSLILVDWLAEDDSGEYYCDVCETIRDPRIRLYCCQDCKYFAHLHCVIPEVLKVLQEDRNDVELKSLRHDIWNVPGCELKVDREGTVAMTLKDVIDQLPEYEKETLLLYYKWNETSSLDVKGKQKDGKEISNSPTVGDEEIDEIIQLSHLSDESFQSFWSSLEEYFLGNEVELKSSDLAMKIVKVKGYMIPHSLAAVLNKLLCLFGDHIVNASNTLSIEFRSFVLFLICKVVKRMRITIPECITKNLLQEWYHHLRFAYCVGFKVEFAQEQLKKLVHAFLGFQPKRLEHEIPTIITQKIVELQQKSNKLHSKLDECNKIVGSSSKSEYQKYCLNMASELKWKAGVFEDRSDVELKCVGRDIWNVPGFELIVDSVGSPNMTLKDVINQMPEYENLTVRYRYKWDETSSEDQEGKQEDGIGIIGDDESDEIFQFAPLSDESFQIFWSCLQDNYRINKMELKSRDLALKMVNVKGYMIPHSLAGELNRLLREFGDIGSESTGSIGFKSFVLFLICKVVQRMRITVLQRITQNLLQEWHSHLTFAYFHNFKVEFAEERLKKLVRIFLGFHAKRVEQKSIASAPLLK